MISYFLIRKEQLLYRTFHYQNYQYFYIVVYFLLNLRHQFDVLGEIGGGGTGIGSGAADDLIGFTERGLDGVKSDGSYND